MSSWTRALALLLLFPSLALAEGKGDAAGALVLFPLLTALVLLPSGWALHALILAHAPRRGLALVQATQRHRWKTLLLGGVNTAFLAFLISVTGGKAPAISFLALLLWLLLVLIGAHGIARGIGAKILGREQASAPPGDLVELSLGWAILLFAAAIPILGLFLGFYWSVRAVGSAVLALLAVEVEVPAELPPLGAEEGEGLDPTRPAPLPEGPAA